MKDLICAICLMVLVVFVSCCLPAIHELGKDRGYRQGQIDYANGKVKYVLTTQPSGEVVWSEKVQAEK